MMVSKKTHLRRAGLRLGRRALNETIVSMAFSETIKL